MNLYVEQFETYHNFPKQDNVKQYYLLCFTARSGSHMLGHTMFKTGQMGFPLEYFNPINLREWQHRLGTSNIRDTYELIKQNRTSPNGIFGCKLSFDHLKFLTNKYNFLDLFPNPKIIFIRRKDLIGQAVSLAKAQMTGVFISSQQSTGQASYDRSAIEKALQKIITDNSCWEYLFARRRLPYIQIYYEDFLQNSGKVIDEIGQFLNVEVELTLNLEAFQLPEKQRDKSNQEFKERFLEEIRGTNFNNEKGFLKRSWW